MPSTTGAFFYSSYFFTSLLETNSEYLHSNVDNWSSRIPGGLSSYFIQGALRPPINKENEHCFFLRVRPEDKTIMLWDSMGNDECHRTYLKAMLRYMYDEYVRKQTGHPATYRDWAREWKATNESHNSPKQTNGLDCGIFTLASMTILAQGTQLRPRTYSQEMIYFHQTRRQLAHLFVSASSQATTHRAVTSSQSTAG